MNLKELMERYNLNSRQSLYARFKSLGLVLEKGDRGKIDASPEQVELLDKLNEHLKKGGSLKSFTPPEPEQTVVVDAEVVRELEQELEPGIKKIDSIIDRLRRIAEEKEQQQQIILLQERSPLSHHRELAEAAREGWLLTSKEIKSILGVYPKCGKGSDVFVRGCWQFTKCGKIGGAIAWLVEKV